MSADLEYVNFSTLKEDWTIFELDDGSVLKAKFVLKLVLRPKGTIGDYSINSDTVVAVAVDKKWWGPPSNREYSLQEIMANIEKEEMSFKTKTPDSWNVYQLEDGSIISVKLELVTISRTSLYTTKGERTYTFNIQPLIKARMSEELKRRLTQKRPESSVIT